MKTLPARTDAAARLRLLVCGVVQGVGFRPFVYRLANELGLAGWVNNSPQGVTIEVEGPHADLEHFRARLAVGKPPRSFIQSCEATRLDAAGYDGFVIRDSENAGGKTALVLPDIATCPDCLSELFDPANRRHRYPFTNCTNCGPRFSIIRVLPYDRTNTSMRGFRMCPECQAEYDDPDNRRFHAQPNACPDCGPQLELWPGGLSHPQLCGSGRESAPYEQGGKSASIHLGGHRQYSNSPRPLAHGNDALLAAAHVIRCGQIVAVKGIGGFHLLVDARNEGAVQRLRERKHREEKPFALMFPTLASVKEECEVSPLEERLLCSPEAPVVLLKKIVNRKLQIVNATAPGNPNLGVMLPSNPLHHLLMAELDFAVIATSANLGDEPICTDEFEALERLKGIADVLLVHNRPIVRPVDDSIVRVMLDREMVLRRARGFAPLPVTVAAGILPAVEPGFQPGGKNVDVSTATDNSEGLFAANAGPGGRMSPSTAGRMPAATVLAVGAHLKNSVALAVGNQAFLSQHIGDLETEPASKAFRRAVADLPRLYDAQPEVIAADLHPDYLSTQFAAEASWAAPAERAGDGAFGSEEIGGPPGKAASRCARRRSPQLVQVQHHIAHVLSCLAENEVELPAVGVAWDGTGLGTDGTIWGGEFFLMTEERAERVAHLRPFRLPGGDVAIKEPRRAALGLLHELADSQCKSLLHMQQRFAHQCSPVELASVETMLARGLNSPRCTSVGRLFDAVAALVGLRSHTSFEGQAAMELEFALEGIKTDATYELPLASSASPMQLDWAGMVESILADVTRGVSIGEISAKFHNALAEAIVSVARRVRCSRVALSGGCFQNRYLTERAIQRLRASGFQPYWHQRVPTNDGGIALGQIVAARLWPHAKAAKGARETLRDFTASRRSRPLCEA